MKLAFLSLLVLTSLAAIAQKNPKGNPAAPAQPKTDTSAIIAHYERMYAAALDFNDLQTATVAMYQILAYRPSDAGIKDTLARLYFTRGMSLQALLAGEEVLESQADNQAILEVVAVCQDNLGLAKEALETYEKLFALTKSHYHQYQVASLQYRLKRLGECQANLMALAQANGLEEQKITMNYGQAGSQHVNLKAAVINMLGVLELDMGKTDTAKQLFEQAIKLDPEFLLALSNLESLNNPKTDKGGASGK